MESVDRLRAYVDEHIYHDAVIGRMDWAIDPGKLARLADAIEAEVAEGYVGLPVDKDGEPIRVGDLVYGEDGRWWHVNYLCIGSDYSVAATDGGKSRELRPGWLTHQMPPTVEGVLEKALNEAAMLDRNEGYWPSAADVANIVNEYAAKLRLAGGDE